MSIKTVFAAIVYAENTLERLNDVVCEEDQEDIAGALSKLTEAKAEIERGISPDTKEPK